MSTVAEWYQTKPGKEVLAHALQVLASHLQEKVGFYGLQIGFTGLNLLSLSQVRSHYYLANPPKKFDSRLDALCFQSDSLDLICVMHQPHTLHLGTLLTELSRCLVADGTLIIVNFRRYPPWWPMAWWQKSKLGRLPRQLEVSASKVRWVHQQYEFKQQQLFTISYQGCKALEVLCLQKQIVAPVPLNFNWQRRRFELPSEAVISPTPFKEVEWH